MKRHISLQPLSREHHSGLLLAQLLRKDMPDYMGMPKDNAGKATYALTQFHEVLDEHFKKEENLLTLCKHMRPDLDILIDEVFAEHETLKAYFHQLDAAAVTEDQLDRIGQLLNNHIRKEERVLFPMLEHFCSVEQLEQFRQML